MTYSRAIDELDQHLRARRAEYHASLLPGASPEALAALAACAGAPLPEAFTALYAWRNGQSDRVFEALQQNRSFMSIDDIVDTKTMMDGMIGTDFDDPRYWRRGWVPFLHNGGGSYLCLDLLAEDGGQPGQLIGFWKADDDRPVEHASTEAWLVWLVSELAAGRLETW